MSGVDQAIDYLLERANQDKLDLEILAHERKSTAISFQKRKMDQFSFSETRQLGVRVLNGNHEGMAYTESLERESLDEMLADAISNARMIHKDAVAELHAGQNLPTMPELYNPQLDQVTIEDKIKAAQDLEAAALDTDSRIASVPYNRYADGSAQVWIANSKGLRGTYKTNSCSAYASCLATDAGTNVMAGEARALRDFRKLDTRALARQAAERTLKRFGATRPATGKYTIVFENRVAETLIGLVSEYFSAKAVVEKTSPLAGKLGEAVFSHALTLTDDPFVTDAAGSRPFDEEGYASRKTPLVERGVVRAFLTNSLLSRQMGLPHTASASRSPATELDVSTSNVVVQAGNHSFEQLVSADSKVIVVNEFLGLAGVRRASGDFSIPAEGFLYEQGQPIRPLKDFLISGNLLQVLGAVEAVGNDARPPVGSIICPSLLVRGLNVAGQS